MPEEHSEYEEIKKRLDEIDRKIEELLHLHAESMERAHHDIVPLESLPEHLKKTAATIAILGQATAEQVAAKTGRTRAAESDYLNQLTNQGFLKKERKNRKVTFHVHALYATCPQCRAKVVMSLTSCPACGASLSQKQQP